MLSSPNAFCVFIVGASHNPFISLNLPFLVSFLFLSISLPLSVLLFFLILSIPRTSNIPLASMASSSSRKRRKHTPSSFKGEGSFSSAQGESYKVTGHPAFPLRDLWYTPSLFFPQVSHGKAPPSTHAWVFSRQTGFVNSGQVLDPREIFDLQIRQGLREAVPIFFDFVARKIQGWPI